MSLLSLSPDIVRRDLDRQPFAIGHQLADHPLLQLERLVELAGGLPEEAMEWNRGDLDVDQAPDQTPANGLSPEETVRRIRDCGSWLVLKRVEQVPAYRELLHECLGQVSALTDAINPNMHRREGFIFVSSPGAITPFHMDPELNFLLQIRGTKVIRVWDPADRDVISEQTLEQYFDSPMHRNLRYDERFGPRATEFELKPGDGVHVPMAVPHWVSVGDQVSVSFSITFRTDATDRRERLHQINARLRRLGLTPTPVGRSALRDRAKFQLFEAYRRARRVVRRPSTTD